MPAGGGSARPRRRAPYGKRTVVIDRRNLGSGFVVFALVKTRHHSADWLRQFRTHVSSIPEVIDFVRIGGDHDDLPEIVVAGMAGYAEACTRLIGDNERETVTSRVAMAAIEEQRPIPPGRRALSAS